VPRITHRRIAVGGAVALIASFAIMIPSAYASSVTGVTASPTPLTAGAPATYTVDFSTSTSGGLVGGTGSITLAGTAGTQFPLTAADYTVNGNTVTALPSDSAADNVTIITPVSISSSTSVVVVAGVGTTATNTTGAQTASISVNTSVDGPPVASSPGYTIVAGPAAQDVDSTGNGQNATVGVAFVTLLSATIKDQFGNPVLNSGTTVTFTAPASGASGTFANGTNTTAAITNGSGVATATTFTANATSGTNVVTASTVGLTGDSFTETNVAGAASQDVATSGAGQSATVGTAFVTALSATIEDSHGNPVLAPGTTVTFTSPASGASGTFANGTDTTAATTNGSGVATATTLTANTAAGAYTVAAATVGLSSANFSETDVAGVASQDVVTAGGGQSTTVGTTFATALSVTLEDAHDNPVLVPGTTVTFTAPASGAAGTFANGTDTTPATTNGSGVATATAFTANTTANTSGGTYTVTASSTGATSGSFNETNLAGTASQDVVTAGGGQSATVGATFVTTLSATIEDSHGNPVLVSGTTVTFAAPASGASGTFANGTDTTSATTNGGGVATATAFTADTTAGPYTVTAASAGSTSASFSETNVSGAAAKVAVTGGNGQTASAGTPFTVPFSATIEDSHGNPVPVGGTPVTFTAPASGASGIFANSTDTTTATTDTSGLAVATTFTADSTGGTYMVSASSPGLTSAAFSESNNVVPGAPTSLTATLGNSTIGLTWTAPSSNGGSPITGYYIYEGPSVGGESTNPVNSTNLSSCTFSSGPSQCTVTGLANGATYFFTVKAVNIVGLSMASNGTSATPTAPATSPTGGYGLAAADGGVFAMGNAGFYGSEGGKRLNKPIVAVVSTPKGGGYWLVASDGGIFAFGNAHFYGSEGGKPLTKPVVGMAATPDGGGYWLVASDGGIFAFGNARFYGSEGGRPLNKPIVGIAADPVTGGYWLVASDGGIFTFNAPFSGSTGGTHLNKPIVGMAADAVTGGYWMVASDGGIFTFGAARFYGSEGGKPLNKPIVGMDADPSTGGYWLVASDGGIFTFNAPFSGSLGGIHLSQPIVGISNP